MGNLYEAASQLFKVSSHSARIEILKTLERSNKSTKDLAKLLDIPEANTHKHIHRLSEEGLIKKDGKNFTLSSSGRIFVNLLLDGIEVVEKYRGLWESHSIDRVPVDLLRDMKVFRDTELIRSAPIVLEKNFKAAVKTQKRLLIATDRLFTRVTETEVNKMIEKKLEVFMIIGHIPHFQSQNPNIQLPPGVEIRIAPMDNIYMGTVIVDDKEAGVIFPDNKGSLDWDYGIYGKDPDFISWAEKNFWNMFKKGEDIRAVKL